MVAVVGDGMYQRRNRIRDFYLHVKQGLMDNRLFENGNEYIFSAQIFAWLDGWKSQLEVSCESENGPGWQMNYSDVWAAAADDKGWYCV